jgi:hypothetical protein
MKTSFAKSSFLPFLDVACTHRVGVVHACQDNDGEADPADRGSDEMEAAHDRTEADP